MATQILASGAGYATSPDQTIAAGAQSSVCLKGQFVNALVIVDLKDDAGAYVEVDRLTQSRVAITLPAGTYRFRRIPGDAADVFGVFSA